MIDTFAVLQLGAWCTCSSYGSPCICTCVGALHLVSNEGPPPQPVMVVVATCGMAECHEWLNKCTSCTLSFHIHMTSAYSVLCFATPVVHTNCEYTSHAAVLACTSSSSALVKAADAAYQRAKMCTCLRLLAPVRRALLRAASQACLVILARWHANALRTPRLICIFSALTWLLRTTLGYAS